MRRPILEFREQMVVRSMSSLAVLGHIGFGVSVESNEQEDEVSRRHVPLLELYSLASITISLNFRHIWRRNLPSIQLVPIDFGKPSV